MTVRQLSHPVLQFIADRPADRRVSLLSDPRALHRLWFKSDDTTGSVVPGHYRARDDVQGGKVFVLSPTRNSPMRSDGLAPEGVAAAMRDMRDQIRALLTLPPPQEAVPDALTHVLARFFLIHPFPDGNGRTGRLLIAACAQHLGRPMTAEWSIGTRPYGPGFSFLLLAYPRTPQPLLGYMRRYFCKG